MDPQVQSALIGGVAGFATGTVGSLFAPWSNWGVEKRRIRHERRRAMVDEWREGLAWAEESGSMGAGLNDRLWYRTLRAQGGPVRLVKLRRWVRMRIPTRLRKLYTPAVRTIHVMPGGGARSAVAVELEGKINGIARKWGID